MLVALSKIQTFVFSWTPLIYTIYTGGEDPAAADQQRPPGLHHPRRTPTHAGPRLYRSVSQQSQTLDFKILTLACYRNAPAGRDQPIRGEAGRGSDQSEARAAIHQPIRGEAGRGSDQ